MMAKIVAKMDCDQLVSRVLISLRVQRSQSAYTHQNLLSPVIILRQSSLMPQPPLRNECYIKHHHRSRTACDKQWLAPVRRANIAYIRNVLVRVERAIVRASDRDPAP